jgi:molybdate transport system permease protein
MGPEETTLPWGPLLLSLQIAALATLISGVVGVTLASWLANSRFAGRDIVDVVLTAPLVLPPTVLGYYLLVVLGHRSVIGRSFEALFGAPIVFTRTGAVVAAVAGSLPLVVKSGRAALEGVDRTLSQAARTLGATPVRAFFTVQLPLAGGGIVAALMLAFARCLGDFGITLMVAGDIPGQTETASLAIYDAIQEHREGVAWKMAVALTAAALAILYLVSKLTAVERDR